jgi:hypothetical protein
MVNQDCITAYAIANPGSHDLVVKLVVVDAEGNVVDDTVTVELSPGEQTAKYFFQDLGFSDFEGTVVLTTQSGGAFIAVGLIQNQALFTVVPVVPGMAPSIPE